MFRIICLTVLLLDVTWAGYMPGGQIIYKRVRFFVYDPNDDESLHDNEFDFMDSERNLKSFGLNKGAKYRWLIHDCMATRYQMKEVAQVFKENHPDDNVIVIDWHRIRKKDASQMEYPLYRDQLEWVSVAVLFAIYTIHHALYHSKAVPSVRENSHIIGFGHGGVIAAHAGWLANRTALQKVKWNYEDRYKISDFVMSRVTVINPIQYCQLERDNFQCQSLFKRGPDYPILLITQDCAKFVDGYYTTGRAYSDTMCPLADKIPLLGPQHHRGVIFIGNNEAHVGGCPSHESHNIYTHCSELKTHCVHQMALSLYTDAMRLVNRTVLGNCNSIVATAFGEIDPNASGPRESVAVNIHIQSENPDVLKGDYGCEAAEPAYPPGQEPDPINGNCAKNNNMELRAEQTWNLIKQGSSSTPAASTVTRES